MKSREKPYASLKSNRRGIYLSLGCWTLLILLLGSLSYLQLSDFTKTIAISQARSHLQKDIAFRAWVASHGGVYVPVNTNTSPNPHLSQYLFRDIQLPDGTPLTLLNPAYLIRLISAEYKKLYGVSGKITSLNPINAENKADQWEEKALRSFEKGSKQAQLFADIDDSPYLRFMLPLVTQKSCLQCHAKQGYQIGDIRGGLAVSLPISTIIEGQHATLKKQLFILTTIWVCGLLFIVLQGHTVLQRQQETLSIAEELRNSREQLKQSLAERDAITATVPDIMYMLNEDGYLHWWNKSLEAVINKPAEEIPTTHALEFFIKEDRGKIARAITRVLTDGHAIVEGKVHTKKGLRHYQLTGVCLIYNEKPYIVGVGRDLSEHRQTEEILLQARKDAESANRLKSAFLSNMSHELRTPLNAILGYTQIFVNDENLSKRHKRGIRTIHEAGEHLLMLINDILDLSKVEAGHMQLVPVEFDLPDFLNGVADVIKIRATEKQLEFRYTIAEDLPRSIVTDELRLRQVLFNLLSNAIKFTETGFCSLIVDATECVEDMLTLSIHVQDSGPGIHPEMKEKIFQPFQQSGDPFKFAEGSGLGLAISRRIITLMDGELTVNSIVGEGSDFSFSIRAPIGEVKKVQNPNTLQQHFTTDGKWLHPIPEAAITEKILQNIKGGNIDAVTELIATVAEMESGRYQEFAKKMASMADDFKLSEMETFLGKTRDKL
jgi:PAS domain S-box-containing protein